MRGGFSIKSKTVDSIPTCDWPPSTIKGIFPSKFLRTCSAFVGEMEPDKFALGAASGKLHSRITAWMNGWDGQRMPTVSPPAVTIFGIFFARGKIKVNGPGQNALANFSAIAGKFFTQLFAISIPAT